jgi:hypothetical protein
MLLISCAHATRGLRRSSLDARSVRLINPHSLRDNEQAWKDHIGKCFQGTHNRNVFARWAQ